MGKNHVFKILKDRMYCLVLNFYVVVLFFCFN